MEEQLSLSFGFDPAEPTIDWPRLLQSGVSAWNEFRSGHPSAIPDLQYFRLSDPSALFHWFQLSSQDDVPDESPAVELARLNLSGANLFRSYLRATSFHCADFRDADARESNLSSSSFNSTLFARCDLRGAQLAGADLSGTDLSEAVLSRARFHRANLLGANLRGRNLTECLFSESCLSGANLHRARLIRADCKAADMSYTDLREAEMSEADLTAADLSHADLRGTNLAGTINFNERFFSSIQWDENTKLPIQVHELPGKPGTVEQRQLIRDLVLAHKDKVDIIAQEFAAAIAQADVDPGTLRPNEDPKPMARFIFRHGMEQGWLKPWLGKQWKSASA